MTGANDARTLIGEINRSRAVAQRVCDFYDRRFAPRDAVAEDTDSAIVMAEVLGNYYTSLETLFLRISQFFENNLRPATWHRDLLVKMTIEVPELRPRVLSDESFRSLRELLSFRHFRRYYLEFDYDWDRLRLVEKAFLDARSRIDDELDTFARFLTELAAESDGGH